MFNNENIVIAMKKIVPIRGTKIKENKAKESLVDIHFRKECLKKAKFNFSLLKICSSNYVFSENKISTLKIESEMKFPKHIKVKLTKKNYVKIFFFNNLPKMCSLSLIPLSIFGKGFSFFGNMYLLFFHKKFSNIKESKTNNQKGAKHGDAFCSLSSPKKNKHVVMSVKTPSTHVK